MNHRIRQVTGVVLAVFAISAAAAFTAEGGQPKVAVVVAGQDPAALAQAREIAAERGAQLRVVNTTAEQLGATHLLAASRYKEVLTIGVDRLHAIDPVAARYPDTRFVAVR